MENVQTFNPPTPNKGNMRVKFRIRLAAGRNLKCAKFKNKLAKARTNGEGISN